MVQTANLLQNGEKMLQMIPRTLTKKEIAIALGLCYSRNGNLVIRYDALRLHYFTDDFILDTLNMSIEEYKRKKHFNFFHSQLIIQHFSLTKEDFAQ